MKYENIIKQLKKDGYEVKPMQFSFRDCLGVKGTALVDTVNNSAEKTTARYADVVKQIEEGMSHIYTIDNNKKILSPYHKL